MEPLTALKFGALALGAYWGYKKVLAPKLGLPGGDKETPKLPMGTTPVSKLEKGKTYTVLAVINKDIANDPRWNTLTGKPEEKIPQIIASTFGQSGFRVLNKPLIRDGFEMQKAINNEPSTWVFNGQWLMDADHVQNVIPWLAGASFYLVPTLNA